VRLAGRNDVGEYTSDPIADSDSRTQRDRARHPRWTAGLQAESGNRRILRGRLTANSKCEEGAKKTIKIYLKYGPAIRGDLASSACRGRMRVFVGQTEIPRVLGGLGSTS